MQETVVSKLQISQLFLIEQNIEKLQVLIIAQF